tara:strand:- start:871 stop:1086 length:216 start_codon:yes stop_codon:yes gene_type:complete
MKLRPKTSTQPRIFEGSDYVHPWYDFNKVALVEYYGDNSLQLNRPNPPTQEAMKKAKFVDKTFTWKHDARL